MTTTIDKFKDAYATMTVAVYEPLILRWVSGWSILLAANTMAWRCQKSKYLDLNKTLATAHAIVQKTLSTKLPDSIDIDDLQDNRNIEFEGMSVDGNKITSKALRPIKLEGFPNAVLFNGIVYPNGADTVTFKDSGETEKKAIKITNPLASNNSSNNLTPPMEDHNTIAVSTPVFTSRRMGVVEKDFDFSLSRKLLYGKLVAAAKSWVKNGGSLHTVFSKGFSNINGVDIFDFLPTENYEEALSPIGIAHYFRQLYFNLDEGYGPIEQCFTVAPKETLEVIVTSTRKQIHEEMIELGYEEISEQSIEERNMEEVSDKVSAMMQRDMSASMSINGSYSTPVWQVGATAQASMSVSNQRSRETATKRLKEVTKHASERITKSYSIKTSNYDELTDSTTSRRVISNENNTPVNYALRRVYKRVRVKVQDLGPRAVWQLYLRNPGSGLAMSRFVHFREATPISFPEIPPGVPPRPEGGTETGSTTSGILESSEGYYFVTIKIVTTNDRRITAVSIDSITDLESKTKEDPAPSAINSQQWGTHWDENTNTFTTNIRIVRGDSLSVSIGYTYSWEPSNDVLREWENKRKEAVESLTEEQLIQQFERNKLLITEKSKIRPRPANELRREERYEVMNRMVEHLFGVGDDPSEPTPLEIECFNRYFDIESMFIYTHPSWWKPRFHHIGARNGRPSYEITADSEPAKLGSSLGWKIQLDGDNRRNEFINSPWLRVCLPIKPDREEEAVRWLAKHVEGDIGFDLNNGPCYTLLTDLKKRRTEERSLGQNSYDYVTVDSTVGAPDNALKPENVFPIIDQFDVTLPTDGFIYDEILVKDDNVGD